MRTLLLRGMLAGLIGGVVAFWVSYFIGEGPLEAGIWFEQAHESAAEAGPEMVSRTIQSTIGLATATVLYGVAIGGLFGLACAVAQGRLGGLGARGTAMVVASAGFLALYLIPALKYPSNPPGTSAAATIGERTQWYLLLLCVSAAVVIGGIILARTAAPRLGEWNAAIACIVIGVAVIATIYAVFPTVNETPDDFSAAVLWEFRLASNAVQLALWATIGLAFGALTDTRRQIVREVSSRPAPASGFIIEPNPATSGPT